MNTGRSRGRGCTSRGSGPPWTKTTAGWGSSPEATHVCTSMKSPWTRCAGPTSPKNGAISRSATDDIPAEPPSARHRVPTSTARAGHHRADGRPRDREGVLAGFDWGARTAGALAAAVQGAGLGARLSVGVRRDLTLRRNRRFGNGMVRTTYDVIRH